MVIRSARVRGRSAKSEVGVVCQQQEMVARVYTLRAAHGVFVTCLLFRACGRGGSQLQCACVGVGLSRARGHRRIEIHIIHRRDMTKRLQKTKLGDVWLIGPGAEW